MPCTEASLESGAVVGDVRQEMHRWLTIRRLLPEYKMLSVTEPSGATWILVAMKVRVV